MDTNEATQTRDSLLAAITDSVATVAPEVNAASVALDTDLVSDLELDSMDLLELVEAIHAGTGIAIAERDQPGLRTVGELLEHLARLAAR